MSFQITNNSANAVVTKIETLSSTYGSLTISSGSFPLLSGDTISGTNTEINNGKGSPEGSILLFLEQGNAQIEYYLNGILISALDYSSGLIEIKGPIVQAGDTIVINVDEAILPVPSPTPSSTSQPTATPTPTATLTPTITPTPSSTPAPAIDPSTLGALWWSQFSNPSFLNLINTNEIDSVIDGIDASTKFKGGNVMGQTFPVQFQNDIHPSCEAGFSGGTKDNLTGMDMISTLNGDYNWSSGITFFSRIYLTASTGAHVVLASDSGGGGSTSIFYDNTSAPYRWFQYKNNTTSGNLELAFWADAENAQGFTSADAPCSANTWMNVAFRAYQDGANYKVENWMNGSIAASGQTNFTAVAPTLNPGVIQAGDYQGSIAESFWFDKKLSDTEMADMFTYLNNRYC